MITAATTTSIRRKLRKQESGLQGYMKQIKRKIIHRTVNKAIFQR